MCATVNFNTYNAPIYASWSVQLGGYDGLYKQQIKYALEWKAKSRIPLHAYNYTVLVLQVIMNEL